MWTMLYDYFVKKQSQMIWSNLWILSEQIDLETELSVLSAKSTITEIKTSELP